MKLTPPARDPVAPKNLTSADRRRWEEERGQRDRDERRRNERDDDEVGQMLSAPYRPGMGDPSLKPGRYALEFKAATPSRTPSITAVAARRGPGNVPLQASFGHANATAMSPQSGKFPSNLSNKEMAVQKGTANYLAAADSMSRAPPQNSQQLPPRRDTQEEEKPTRGVPAVSYIVRETEKLLERNERMYDRRKMELEQALGREKERARRETDMHMDRDTEEGEADERERGRKWKGSGGGPPAMTTAKSPSAMSPSIGSGSGAAPWRGTYDPSRDPRRRGR